MIQGISHQRGVEKGIPNPPDHCNENKHWKSFGKGEDGHCNDVSDQAGENDSFSAVEVQYSPTQPTTDNVDDRQNTKKSPGFETPWLTA